MVDGMTWQQWSCAVPHMLQYIAWFIAQQPPLAYQIPLSNEIKLTHLTQLINDLLFGGLSASLEPFFYIQEGLKEAHANLASIRYAPVQVAGGDVYQGLQVTSQCCPVCLL